MWKKMRKTHWNESIKKTVNTLNEKHETIDEHDWIITCIFKPFFSYLYDYIYIWKPYFWFDDKRSYENSVHFGYCLLCMCKNRKIILI